MHVRLHNKKAFTEILKDYAPAPQSVEALKNIQLVILLGVSGGGRNTIINHLVKTGNYKFIVSDTTRPPKTRDGKLEKSGVEYYFRSEADVLQDLREGKFLEAELIHNQQVSGISIRELEQAAKTGKIPINEVDFDGTNNIYKIKPDTQFFFVVPPSYDVWMERLHGRESMTDLELQNRLITAITVLETGLQGEHFTFVINDDSLKSAERIDKQVRGHKNIGHHEEALVIAQTLLDDIRAKHSALI